MLRPADTRRLSILAIGYGISRDLKWWLVGDRKIGVL
jgi:hypothetical protein